MDTIAPYVDLLTGKKTRNLFRRPSQSVRLDFAFEHDDDVKSAAIILRALGAQLRAAGRRPRNYEAVLLARLEWARAQQRLNAGVQLKEGEL